MATNLQQKILIIEDDPGISNFLKTTVSAAGYVATMLPVVVNIANLMHVEPYLFAFSLLIGATLGGNITPIGASANIAGIGILQKEGYKVSTRDFIRIGIPFTRIAALSGAIVIWLIWASSPSFPFENSSSPPMRNVIRTGGLFVSCLFCFHSPSANRISSPLKGLPERRLETDR